MNCIRQRHALTAAATALLMVFTAGAQAEGLSREQVRAELAEARAQGLLDRAGEAGASADVLQARELYNETQARVLLARQELAQERSAALPMFDRTVYLEEGPAGPLMVMVTTAPDGSLGVVEAPAQVGLVAAWVEIDVD